MDPQQWTAEQVFAMKRAARELNQALEAIQSAHDALDANEIDQEAIGRLRSIRFDVLTLRNLLSL